MIKIMLLDVGHTSLYFPGTPADWSLLPITALTDTWWSVLPIALAMWIWLKAATAAFRLLVWTGASKPLERGRLARLSRYLSAAIVAEALLLLAADALDTLDARVPGYHWSKSWLGGSILLFWGLAFVCHISASIGALTLAPRRRILRALLLFLYPAAAFLAWVLLLALLLWVSGFFIIGILSMMR
jgi:hypothetical protein